MGTSDIIPSNTVIANIFSVGTLIGKGAYGEVYSGVNMENDRPVAIKFEKVSSGRTLRLENEFVFYNYLKGARGFPKMYYFGKEEKTNVLVMDVLGPSLDDLFTVCNRKFSLKTVLMLAEQMIYRLKTAHEAGFIHRDLKPENFVMGQGLSFCNVHLIDLGMAAFYRDPETEEHLPQTHKSHMVGTMRYISINAHTSHSQSRRDDLESLGYVLIYLLKGTLPWQGINASNSTTKQELVYVAKRRMSIKKLCEHLPEEFEVYMTYCRMLPYDDKPNYKYLIHLFRKLFRAKHFVRDYNFDWMKKMYKPTDKKTDDESDPPRQLTRKERITAKCQSLYNLPCDYNELKKRCQSMKKR